MIAVLALTKSLSFFSNASGTTRSVIGREFVWVYAAWLITVSNRPTSRLIRQYVGRQVYTYVRCCRSNRCSTLKSFVFQRFNDCRLGGHESPVLLFKRIRYNLKNASGVIIKGGRPKECNNSPNAIGASEGN